MTDQDNNIAQEISEMAPILASLPKSNVYQVPDKYFEEVESSIIHQLNLVQHEKQDNKGVPSDYFEKLDDVILKRIGDNGQEAKVVTMPSRKLSILKYAAIFVALIACMVVLNYLTPKQDTQVASQLTQAELLDYMADHAEEFDINMLIDQELIDESTLDGISYITVEDETTDLFESDF